MTDLRYNVDNELAEHRFENRAKAVDGYVWDLNALQWVRMSGNPDGSQTLPTGAATSAKQDSQIVLETALKTLITTLNSTVTTNDKTHLLLQQIRDSIAMRPDYVEATNTQAISGTVAVAGITGTATITTLTNQTNIGGFSADMITENASFQDWAISIRSLYI